MAARKQLWHPDEVRRKIQASQLINRLMANAVSEQEIMTTGQIRSAEILLKKVIPDMASMQVSGDPENPLTLVTKIELVAPDDNGSG